MRRLAASGAALLLVSLLLPTLGPPAAAARTSAREAFDVEASRRLLAATNGPPRAAAAAEDRCYGSFRSDARGDAPELDVVAYTAAYRCATRMWEVTARTAAPWSPAGLKDFVVLLDTDADETTGCRGFDSVVHAFPLDNGVIAGGVVRTSRCEIDRWTRAGDALVTHSGDQLSVLFEQADLNSPTGFRWYGALDGRAAAAADEFPNVGVHAEAGYLTGASGPCDTPAARDAHFATFPDRGSARRGAEVLRGAGLAGARVMGGVVAFRGDPLVAQESLSAAGLRAEVGMDRLRRPMAEAAPDDPRLAEQWALTAVQAPEAWSVTKGSAAITVAVIDSGVDASHPELADKLLPGVDAFTGGPLGSGNSDLTGHGTAVAGVVAAATDNGLGVASLGWRTRVLPIRAFQHEEDGDYVVPVSAEIAAIGIAVERGAKVINLSFGGSCASPEEERAIRRARDAGVLVVAAAGNDGPTGQSAQYPAAYAGVLAVGALDRDLGPASYSGHGPYVDLAAPGGEASDGPGGGLVVLAPGGGFDELSGTSFAAPLVAAAGALLLADDPRRRPDDLRSVLVGTARDLGEPGHDPATGAGVLQVRAALDAADLGGRLHPLAPARLLDTRNGTGGRQRPLPDESTLQLDVTGVGGVPERGVVGVVLNVTVTDITRPGFLTVSPTGTARPIASNLNFNPGQTVPNLVVAKVGTDGRVDIYNPRGSVHVVADVVGWLGDGAEPAGERFTPLAPVRVLDTRLTGQTLGPDGVLRVPLTGDVVPPEATAVMLNATVDRTSATSFLTISPAGRERPVASNLNWSPGNIVANLVLARLGDDGAVDVYNARGSVDVIFDVVGYSSDAGDLLRPLPPARLVDTRTSGAPLAKETLVLPVAGRGGVPLDASAVVLNLTGVQASTTTVLTAFPSGAPPLASNLNLQAGDTRPNLVVVAVGPDGAVRIDNARGTVHVVADVVGWFGA